MNTTARGRAGSGGRGAPQKNNPDRGLSACRAGNKWWRNHSTDPRVVKRCLRTDVIGRSARDVEPEANPMPCWRFHLTGAGTLTANRTARCVRAPPAAARPGAAAEPGVRGGQVRDVQEGGVGDGLRMAT